MTRYSEFVKKWANDNNTTYGCATSNPDLKRAWKEFNKDVAEEKKQVQNQRRRDSRQSIALQAIPRMSATPRASISEAKREATPRASVAEVKRRATPRTSVAEVKRQATPRASVAEVKRRAPTREIKQTARPKTTQPRKYGRTTRKETIARLNARGALRRVVV
tara:strand:+ start:685 stop:1173 length:489 start_codon:yes stop_codon:yes gene_type:complete